MSRSKILTIAGAVLLVLAIAGCVFLFLFYSKKVDTLTEEKDAEIEQLLDVVNTYGDVARVYYLLQDVVAGQEVTALQVYEKEIPTSMLTSEYVVDMTDLKSSYYKVDAKAHNPITYAMIGSDIITHQDRYIDVVTHIAPVYLKQGDFVDLRITTDYGQDFLVLPKKRVVNVSANSVQLILNEEDLHKYNSALVDSYIHPGTITYLTTYIEPAFQREAHAYYPVSEDVLNTMLRDPNIKQIAEQEIIKDRRTKFETELEQHTDPSRNSAIVSGRTDHLERLRQDIAAHLARISEGVVDAATGLPVEEEGVIEE